MKGPATQQTSVLCPPGSRAHFDAMMAHNTRAARGEVAMPPQTPRQAARHEAAHAIAALRFGGRFAEVALTPDRTDSHGHCRSTFARPRVIEVVVVLWAGAVADGHVFGSGDDLDQVQALAGTIDSQMSLDGFRAATLIVAQYRPLLERLAAALETARRLTFAEVVELVGTVRQT